MKLSREMKKNVASFCHSNAEITLALLLTLEYWVRTINALFAYDFNTLHWLIQKKASKFFSISFGEVLGEWRSTGFPFLSTINFVKFHLMPSNSMPPCSFFKYCHNGWAVFPFTSIFSNRSNLTLRSRTKHWISSAFPGSWWLNWSQGNARMRKPKT